MAGVRTALRWTMTVALLATLFVAAPPTQLLPEAAAIDVDGCDMPAHVSAGSGTGMHNSEPDPDGCVRYSPSALPDTSTPSAYCPIGYTLVYTGQTAAMGHRLYIVCAPPRDDPDVDPDGEPPVGGTCVVWEQESDGTWVPVVPPQCFDGQGVASVPSGADEEPEEGCVPSWSSTNEGPRWWRESGSAWWGTVRIATNGCGTIEVSTNRDCWVDDCVATATSNAWDSVRSQIDATSPTIYTSPDTESLVWVATWFWHDEWRPFAGDGTHPQAPVTVTVAATPIQTWWDYGQGETICTGPPQPFDFGLLATDEDPDADCNSHRYTYPSRSTGPGGENIYELRASVEYDVSCAVQGAPQPYSTPNLCSPQWIYMQAPIGTFDLEVYELQSVIRPNP